MRSQLEMASRKRKSNFGHTEIMTLLEGVADNKRLLLSSFWTDVKCGTGLREGCQT